MRNHNPQIIGALPGKHSDGVPWPDEDPDVYADDPEAEIHIEENGTDYKAVSKSARLYDALIHDDSLIKAYAEEEEEVEDDGDEEKEEVEEKLGKSFFNFVEANPTLVEGINSSPFLYEMVKSIGYTFVNLENRLGSALHRVDSDFTNFAKGLDGVFDDLNKSLGNINGLADDVDMYKSQGAGDPNVEYLEKGGFAPSNSASRSDVLHMLVKGVEDGIVPPLAVIKFEHTGFISPDIQKSIGL